MPTMTAYPDAHPETNSVDGYAYYTEGDGDTWAAVRAAAGLGAIDSLDSIYPSFHSHTDTDKWWSISRDIIVFDISGVPAGSIIASVTLRLHLRSKADELGIAANWLLQVYSAAPASNIGLAGGDYDSLGVIEWSDTGLPYNSAVAGKANDIVLNSIGIAAVQAALDGDGKVKMGLKEKYYDNDGNVPTWVSFAETQLRFRSADDSDLYAPGLVITYGPSIPLVDTDVATNITSTSATLNGEITDTGGENPYERGFEWAETQDVPMTNSWTETGDFGTGTFSHPISGLDAAKTYYYRAKAQNDAGWGYGAVRTLQGAYVYPAEAITRVTNLIHRYSPGNFTLEMALGEVTSDFGLPQYMARPIASTPAVEEGQIITKMGVEGFQTAEQFMDVMEQGYQGRPMPESVRAKAEKTAAALEKHNREVLERLKRLAVAKQEAKDLREKVAATRERLAAAAREEEAAQRRIAELKAAGAGKPVPTFAEWLAAQAKKVLERFKWW